MKKLICAISKSELDMECWIDYYLTIGFEIWILDHNDEPTIQERNKVKVFRNHKQTKKNIQLSFYNSVLKTTDHDWVALLDCDEYLIWNGNIDEILDKYKNYAALCPNWLRFGPNKHITKPEGRVFDNFNTRESALHRVMKPIVQPKHYKDITSPHFIISNIDCTTPSNQIVRNQCWCDKPSDNLIWINHYVTKSLEHWKIKVKRGQLCGPVKHLEDFSFFEKFDFVDNRCKNFYKKNKIKIKL